MLDLTPAQERLGPLHDLIVEGFKAGVGKWGRLIELDPELALPLDATARANFIHPHICREVELRLSGIPGIQPTDALDCRAIKVLPEYVGAGVPHNYRTRRQRLLANQQYDEEMMARLSGDPNFEPPTFLTAGYTLDGAELERVEIRRDCENHLSWRYDIFGGTALEEPFVLPGLEDTTRPAVVRSKKRPPLELVTDEEEARADE